MKTNYRFLIASLLLVSAAAINAQTPTGSDYLKAYKKANCTIAFDVNAEGEPFHIKWGMDTAWDWDWNVTRGVNYYEKGKFETGRISFQPNDLVKDNGDGTYTLSSRQQTALKKRINLIKLTGTTEVNINCDHEALFKDDDLTGYNNYVGKPEEWYKLIKASVQYAQKQGMKVISISPFNEPDYGWMQYKHGAEYGDKTRAKSEDQATGMKDFLAIAKLIKADSFFDGIRVCGGNTLNNASALTWYNYLKDYLDEGNTHQLAGSFDTYAEFFTQVKADGKEATADELHNVGEAIVGVNYGMTNGIWWGFDSRARGQFMHDSNEGVRLGYGEHRSTWTDGAVYRNDETGEVHGYIGSSERQAVSSSFEFVSTSRDVYFNGEGPTRHFVYDIPGGKSGSYQDGQINAERVFDITWGEDVAQGAVDGTYQVMHAASKNVLTWKGSDNVKCAQRVTSGSALAQQWKVYPSYKFGDISFWFIDNVSTTSNKVNLNVLNNNLNANAGVICYNADHGDVEQWYVKYVKDGYYYIISRLSNKYLYCGSTSTSTGGTNVSLQDPPAADITEANLKKYLWRFIPTNARAETAAPKAPTQLAAKQRTASIELSWMASTSSDAASYTIIRGETPSDGEANAQVIEWNTIGRNIEGTSFLDNTALPGRNYTYKIKTVDLSGNRSEDSEMLGAKLLDEKALICQIQFDDTLCDNTANRMDAKLYGTEEYSGNTLHKSGTKSLNFKGTQYAIIPNAAACQDEITIATWVRWGTKSNWQRIFDFGSDEEHYMFFTPSNGSQMRFVMKNGSDEEILTTGKNFVASTWHHLAITIKPIEGGKVQAIIYVDGKKSAETNDFTILPSDIKPALCFIGRSQFVSDPFFNGRLDDFRIYNYALSEEQVAGIVEDLDAVSKDVIDSYVDVNPTSITTVKKDNAKKGIYDLNGRKVNNTSNGIYIKNGKKVLR